MYVEIYLQRYIAKNSTLCPMIPVSLWRSDHPLLVSACRAGPRSAPLLATSLKQLTPLCPPDLISASCGWKPILSLTRLLTRTHSHAHTFPG